MYKIMTPKKSHGRNLSPPGRAPAPTPPGSDPALRRLWGPPISPGTVAQHPQIEKHVFPPSFTGTAGAEPFQLYVFKFCPNAAVPDLCFRGGRINFILIAAINLCLRGHRR